MWETLKAVENIEANPTGIDDRLIDLTTLVNAKNSTRNKKINDIIRMEEEEEENQTNFKNRGMKQVDEEFIIQMAMKKKGNWGGIWRSVK
mmetsp:Transcript_28218/g.21091  ORF Transcript_28218/g.21091 Transcript_28218/m.21091 type:complete len:90 (-) Transcript_28218:489-758(-)